MFSRNGTKPNIIKKAPLDCEAFMLLLPTEDGTVSSGRVRAGEVHRIGTTRGGTLANVTMGAHRHEHELMIQIVLPHEDFGFRGIGCQAHITSNAIT